MGLLSFSVFFETYNIVSESTFGSFFSIHSFFNIRMNFIKILRLNIAKEQWKFKNKKGKVEA